MGRRHGRRRPRGGLPGARLARRRRRVADYRHERPSWPRTVNAKATTFDDLIARRQGDIAIVATPPADHVDAAVALLDAGYHVVVEAPMACTLAGADQLIEAETRLQRPVLYSEHLVGGADGRRPPGPRRRIGALTHLSARADPGTTVVATRGRRRRPLGWRAPCSISACTPSGSRCAPQLESGAGRPVSLSARHRRRRHPPRARHDQAPFRVRAGRHDRRSLATRRHARLGPAGVERQRGAPRRAVPHPDARAQRRSGADRSADPSGRAVAGRRLRLRAAAQTLLDEHPHRSARAGHLTSRTSGARRDLRRALVGRAGTRSTCRSPSPAHATRPRPNSSRLLPVVSDTTQ